MPELAANLIGRRKLAKQYSKDQDFNELRAQCLKEGKLFEDPEFECPETTFKWLRPKDIASDPHFFVEGASRFDVKQGHLGDCWLLAAVANLTLRQPLFNQIVPADQEFNENYAGIFYFRFWQYGQWVQVVIDDRLPTTDGHLVYLRSSQPNEFWSALLEKAYAKLNGGYEALEGGSTCEAMEDFTGGVAETYELSPKADINLFNLMLNAYERDSLLACSIDPNPDVTEDTTPEGLVRGHAYSITRVARVNITTPGMTGKIPLLRLRNPWGNEKEWRGAWSDKSREWQLIPDSEKKKIGITFEEDGEFWMSYKDFVNYFNLLEIVNLNPDELMSEGKKKWEGNVFEGKWVRGVTAGGCRNHLKTYHRNPQYRITLVDPDEEDDDNKCTVIIGLMQKNRRALKKSGGDCLTIGFAVYHLDNTENETKPLNLNFFKYNTSCGRSPSYINQREVSCRLHLPPGVYCIVPSTFDPDEEGAFILRVFTEKKTKMEEHDEHTRIIKKDPRVMKNAASERKNKPNEDFQKFNEFFKAQSGDDMEVDWQELKKILDSIMKDAVASDGFSKDVCRSMIAMMDVDRTGKLGYEEFVTLMKAIKNYEAVFKLYKESENNELNASELREALSSAGYRLSTHALNNIVNRYATKKGIITFDDFLICVIRLKTILDLFEGKDRGNTGSATFKLEEWVERTMYL